MASTVNPPSKIVTEWCRVFQALGTESYTSSVTFMKQLTVVALSTITYMKNAFSQENYTLESFNGLKLNILKKKCEDELAQFLSSSLMQAFEAFDKKYLRQLVLCLYEDECSIENLMEYYIFEYSYNTDGVSMNIQSKSKNSEKKTVKFEDVEKQTTHLMRSCIVMLQTTAQVMPNNYEISLRLYYNDSAPESYQAPGFQPCPGADHLAASQPRALALGWVSTGHHKLTARIFTRDDFVSGEAEPSQNAPQMTQGDDQISFLDSVSDTTDVQIRCPCNKNEDIGETLITCYYCGTQQHAACFGLLPAAARTAPHCCTACSDAGRPPSDLRLAALGARKRECLCMFRLCLRLARGRGSLAGAALAAQLSLSALNVTKLMRLLRTNGILEAGGDDLMTPRKINSEMLNLTISKYFQNTDEAPNCLAETFGSQESVPDPVGDVLSPLERVSLQRDSNIGRVVANPELNKNGNRAAGDALLQQYRAAISSSAETMLLDNEPPLSGHAPDVDKVVKDMEMKCSVKRKIEDGNEASGRQLRPGTRSGVKSKKARKY